MESIVSPLLDPVTTASVRVIEDDLDASAATKADDHITGAAERSGRDESLGEGLSMWDLFAVGWNEAGGKLLSLAFTIQIIQVVGEMMQPIFAGIIVDSVVQNKRCTARSDPACAILNGLCSMSDAISKSSVHCSQSSEHELLVIIIGYVIVGLVTASFTVFASALKRIAGAKLLARLRNKLFGAILARDMAMFDATSTGALTNRLSADIAKLGDLLTYEVANRLGSIVNLVGGVIYVAILSWRLTLYAMAMVPVSVIVSRLFAAYYRKVSKRLQDALAVAAEIATESFLNIQTVKTASCELKQRGRYAEAVEICYGKGKKMAWARGIYRGSENAVDLITEAVVLYVGARQVFHGDLSAGQFTTYILFAQKISASLSDFYELYGSFQNALGATERVFKIMEDGESKTVNIPAAEVIVRPQSLRQDIVLHQLHFRYPARPKYQVLAGVNLTLKAGATTALCGPSGGGKSSIIKMLTRLYEPTAGQITIGGVPLTSYSRPYLHSRMAVVSQEPILFSCSIADNIRFFADNGHNVVGGNIHAGMGSSPPQRRPSALSRVRQAAALANAHEFICNFPRQYDTPVGEQGTQLSGGQKQRIAIARAIMQEPDILLLDEATSALDNESESLVQEALDGLMAKQGLTVLVVAHRLSTIKKADTIAVVEAGRIVEQGTHEQLLRTRGHYAKMVSLQS